MKTNLYNQHPALQFRGSSSNNEPQTNSNKFSLMRAQVEKYKFGHTKPIIPDLLDYIAITGKVNENDIKGIAGHSGLSIVFDLGDEVLKGSLENPLEFRNHNPEIDIPFLSSVEKIGKTYFVKEAKADTKNVSKEDCIDIIKRLKKLELEPSSDLDIYKTWQIGKYQGKTYILDTRCAVPRPNRFSRFIYDFKIFNSMVSKGFYCSAEALRKEEQRERKLVELFGSQILHLDETPRPNLSLKRGFTIMRGVINRNLKYGLPGISINGLFTCIKRAVLK